MNTAAPVFVGGSGRSGTTILGALLGQHAHLALVPGEARLHAEPYGLPALLAGKADLDMMHRRLIRHYWQRKDRNGWRGLHKLGLKESHVVGAADAFRDTYHNDSSRACATLVTDLFAPLVTAKPTARTWVEMTPPNVEYANLHQEWFPNAKTLHIVRDGRDVAVSVERQKWGAKTQHAGLDWWDKRLRDAQAAVGDPDRVLVIGFEQLMLTDRDREYGRMLDFLGLPDDPTMRAYFDTEMTPDRAHVAQWKADVPAARHAEFDQQYRDILDAHRRDGITCTELLQPRRGLARLLRR